MKFLVGIAVYLGIAIGLSIVMRKRTEASPAWKESPEEERSFLVVGVGLVWPIALLLFAVGSMLGAVGWARKALSRKKRP